MSGQLVGEIIDALEAGRIALSQGEALALIAIAEKCQNESREGSVRLGRIAGAMGKSEPTAKRATRKLREYGLVEVVKRGYKSHGVGHATVFRIAVLGSSLGDPSTTVSAGITPEMIPASDVLGSNTHVLGSNRASAEITQGDLHDGLYDGLNDGQRPPAADEPRCPKHADPSRYPIPPPCPGCKQIRDRRERAADDEQIQAQRRRAAIRSAIDACGECDAVGRLDDLTDCPKHPNHRQAAIA